MKTLLKIILICAIASSMACGEVTCQEVYEKDKVYYVNIDQVPIEPSYFEQAFDEFLAPLNYRFELQTKADQPVKLTARLLSDNPHVLGTAGFGDQYINLVQSAGPEVIAHEIFHTMGVGHLDPEMGCHHLMAPSICFPVYELTPEDIELYNNRAIKCDP